MEPSSSPLLRRLIIRGDITALGVVLLAGAPLVAAAAGTVGSWLYGLALVLLPLGVGSLLYGRRAYQALLREAAERHGSAEEPGVSPVSWVADGVWARRNRFDPWVDAPNVLLAEIDPLVKAPGDVAEQALVDPVLRPVGDGEKEMIATDEVGGQEPGPQGSSDKLLALLAGTPGRFIGVSVRWPVCCGGLTTLTGMRVDEDAPEGVWLPATDEPREWGTDTAAGDHRFQCRRCGRRYATDPAW